MNLNRQFLKVAAGFAAVCAGSALRANPMQVTGATMSQDSGYTTLTVQYNLTADAPAFVRLDILTNDVSIGTENIKTVSGDGYSTNSDSLISSGLSRKIVWAAKKDWPGHLSSNAQAKVMAYYTNSLASIPGVYLVVDLSGGPNAASYPIGYSLTPPDPLTDDTCCSNKLWLKRVETNTFEMGSSTAEAGHQSNEDLHDVTLTNVFFIGVFPVTQAQYALVMGSVPSGQSGSSALCPVNKVSYDAIRGSTNDVPVINWPKTGTNILARSFLGVLRSRTGSLVFDLPTDAQWECACRAGTETAWNNGTDYSVDSSGVDANLDLLGWYANTGSSSAGSARPVGRKTPNAWGLYDCHGNVYEWCLDWNNDRLGTNPVWEPIGVDAMSTRVMRGGAWGFPAVKSRSPARNSRSPSTTDGNIGFRLTCRIWD